MKTMLFGAALIALLPVSASGSALIGPSTGVAIAVQDDVVLVKKGKARPHGWSRGRKVGWRGRGMPPGQARKFHHR